MPSAATLAAALLAASACHKPPDPAPGAASAPASAVASAPASAPGARPKREKVDAAEVRVPPGKSQLHVAWDLPEGTGINDEAPFSVRWTASDGLLETPTDIKGLGKEVARGFDIPIALMKDSPGGMLSGDLDLVVCDVATHAVCVPLHHRLELTFAVQAGAPAGQVHLPLPQAKQ